MKLTSQKILLSLYSPTGSQNEGLTISFFSLLLPELSNSGLRSLLYILEKRKSIAAEKIDLVTYYYLTKKGEEDLITLFPALKNRSNQELKWQCIVFKSAPKGDEQFRYLRSILVQSNAFVLSRGAYAQPGGFSKKILDLCHSLYLDSLFLFTVEEWQLGIERSVITRNFGLADLASSYSGVSRELMSLLAEIERGTRLSSQQKLMLFTAFDRFRELLKEDVGLLPYFFSQTKSAIELQEQFHQLFQVTKAI